VTEGLGLDIAKALGGSKKGEEGGVGRTPMITFNAFSFPLPSSMGLSLSCHEDDNDDDDDDEGEEGLVP